MDRRALGVWCVLALLVVSAAVSRAVTIITLESMTWSTDSLDQTLNVCATDTLTSGIDEARLAVRSTDGTNTTLKNFGGVPENSETPKCAVFTVTESLPAPDIEERTYELTTYTNNVFNDRGEVTFAFPLTQDATVDCGFSQFTRFSVEADGGPTLTTSDCLTDSTFSACYITENLDPQEPVCVTGLDQSPENADFKVCVPNNDNTLLPPDALITAVSLSYDDARTSGDFTITSETTSDSLELLIQTGTGSPRLTTCSEYVCTFDGTPSTNLYDLCGVYIVSGSATSAETHSFQDLQLTVDVVSDTTVDFRFANLNTPDLTYNVYGGDSAEGLTTNGLTFTLDCSHISNESFCNGFFDNEGSLNFIGVSFSEENDIVIAPTTTTTPAPATTTSITSTTSPTSAPTSPSFKVKQNAVDLTDQKTEGIVPSSA